MINRFQFLTAFIFLVTLSACSTLVTCDICGYIAAQDEMCEYCGNNTWKEGMPMSKEDYVTDKQLHWFFIPGDDVNFYEPKDVTDPLTEKRYQKDAEWKPQVTKEEVIQANQ